MARFLDKGAYLQKLAEIRLQGNSPIPRFVPDYGPVARTGEIGNCPNAALEFQPCAHLTDPTPPAANCPLGVPKGKRAVKDNFVNRAVEKWGSAVVRVQTEQKVAAPDMDNADIFSFFFGIKPDSDRPERKIKGHGSGFCIDGGTGVILTNAHVVQGADTITALFAGQEVAVECEILESDETIDLAAIRIKTRPSKPLPCVSLGSSESVRTGDWAIVLGNPFGLQNTCTLGIVSSMDRSTGESGFDWMRHPLLQTDAAVNQGNSGGPMLNEAGDVIGIISMRALFGEGIGFAIPIDSAKAALPNLLRKKKVPRAYLGLKMATDTTTECPNSEDGVRVEIVIPKSPAQEAGIEVGDEIVRLEGRTTRRFNEVQSIVRSANVGDTLRAKLRRNGKSLSVDVKAADIRQLRERTHQRQGQPRVIILK